MQVCYYEIQCVFSFVFAGMTAEEFVDKPKSGTDPKAYGVSMYDKFRAKIASLLGKPKENVDIFTVRNVPGMEKMVDVRFSAHGSPYYRPSKLNGLMESNKNEVCWIWDFCFSSLFMP